MSMADRDGFIWQDGKLVPWREATTHVLTHSLHYGLAVFEGVRAYNTVSGLILDQLAHIPITGEKLEWNGFTFEIVDMDGARIDKILVSQKQQP